MDGKEKKHVLTTVNPQLSSPNQTDVPKKRILDCKLESQYM